MALFSLQSEFGTLKLTGYLRGRNLSVNRLVHLPGWGDYQMTQIDAVNDPYPLLPKSDKRNKTQVFITEDLILIYMPGQVYTPYINCMYIYM